MVLAGPFQALWRAVGSLALVEAACPEQALQLLAQPPTDEVAGSYLAVAGSAVRASIAQLAGDHEVDRLWREVLSDATQYSYRALAVDALEALAARSVNEPRVAGRLLGSAEQLRATIGYRHRFTFQQEWVDLVGETADQTSRAESSTLDWRSVAEWVSRSWGDRHRPTFGWDSLTPTELRVIEFVATGLTNPQIADRLLMSRSTVKTHLAHTFAKLGVHTRTELAAAMTHREAS
jgi:DNA-binding NarL/FixJ family response regulator